MGNERSKEGQGLFLLEDCSCRSRRIQELEVKEVSSPKRCKSLGSNQSGELFRSGQAITRNKATISVALEPRQTLCVARKRLNNLLALTLALSLTTCIPFGSCSCPATHIYVLVDANNPLTQRALIQRWLRISEAAKRRSVRYLVCQG